jgi:hypothetical protein
MTDTARPPRSTAPRRAARTPNTEDDGAFRPPHSPDLEADLLAAAMHAKDALEVLVTVPVEAFYVPRNKLIAEALHHAHAHGWAPDRTFVLDELTRMGILDDIGGTNVIAELLMLTPSTANARRYADRIEADYTRRRYLTIGLELAEHARTGAEARIVDEVLPALEDLQRARAVAAHPFADISAALNTESDSDGEPILLHRSDGKALLYAGALNYLHGEPGKGKSWVALWAAHAAIKAGLPVVVIDFEDTVRGIGRRLLTLGLSLADVVAAVRYIDEPTTRSLADLSRLAIEGDPGGMGLVIIDGVAASMTAADLDEDKASDVNRWVDTLVRPIATNGSVVLGVDHVTKSKESRGLWPRGSGAKRARIDGAAYSIEADVPFSRSQAGKLKLRLAKDRRGFIGGEGDLVGILNVKPRQEGAALDLYLDPPKAMDELDLEVAGAAGPGVRGDVAEAVIKVLEEQWREAPFSRDALLDELRGRHVKVSATTLSATLVWLRRADKVVHQRDGRRSGYALPPKQGGLHLVTGPDADVEPDPTQSEED